MPNLTITVLLSPNRKFTGNPDGSWPKPQGVELRLTNREKEKATDPVNLDATASGGVTSGDVLAGTYAVTVVDADFNDWEAPGAVTIDPDDTEKAIVLVPVKDRWLLPLLLCRYDDDGNPVGIPGAEWSYRYDGEKTPGGMRTEGGPFAARDDGYVYAALDPGTVTLSFQDETAAGAGLLKPQSRKINFRIPRLRHVDVTQVQYLADDDVPASPLGRLSIEPLVKTIAGAVCLTGASATIEYGGPSPRTVAPAQKLGPDEKKIWFNDLLPGIYAVTVTPPATFNNWPVKPSDASSPAECVTPGTAAELRRTFRFEMRTVQGRVQAMDGRLVDQDVNLEIYGSENFKVVTARNGTFETELDWGVPLKIRLARNAQIRLGDIPLDPGVSEQPLSLTDDNLVVIPFKYGVEGHAVDEAGNPAPGAVIDVFDEQQKRVGSAAARAGDGYFVVGTSESGNYYVAPRTEDGEPVTRGLVLVNSVGNAGNVTVPSGRGPRADARTTASNGDGQVPGGNGHGRTPEAFTDLAAYPVLTEEISTTGVPAPVGGGFGGSAGAGYGQAVDQVIRDVLGWRPGGDLAGFQAALNGAFQLREVEGHTVAAWQQRGYAVQADMGALTGAQASIYARAKAALDQIQPLLAGLTSLNPAKFEPQDLETIRSVVRTELQELVSELSLEGGPRIQRVDELFRLLLGQGNNSRSMNPDLVQGQLGKLRERFALTVDEVQTVDEERIVTNFRIIVDQVLALHASWSFDKKLLSGMSRRASFGTVLVWLSRGLEAVCESVGDLTFALDSVFVDAAQRQVIQLRFANLVVQDVPLVPFRGNPPSTAAEPVDGHAPMFLSDLLDWVLRTSRDEGPRIIQDAGKDGVLAFKPVLNTLRLLVRATLQIARERSGRSALPDGMRTPRVHRALQVLASQLDEAANLASLVQVEEPPTIAYASINPSAVKPGQLLSAIQVTLTGSNFRGPARAVLAAEDDEGIANLETHAVINPSNGAIANANFTNTARIPANPGATWMVSIINDDETQSNWVEVLRVGR
jgi:hypothetical protein